MGNTAEQQARDLLESCGVEDAQAFTAGDVVGLANLIADFQRNRSQLERIRALVATWAVDDDTYLHLDGPDLGYADAAVQIAAIIEGKQQVTNDCPYCEGEYRQGDDHSLRDCIIEVVRDHRFLPDEYADTADDIINLLVRRGVVASDSRIYTTEEAVDELGVRAEWEELKRRRT